MNGKLLIVVPAALAALTLSACSGSSNKSASTASDSSTPPTSAASSDTSSAANGTAATSAQLAAMVVQASEVPTGYTGAAYVSDPTDASNQVQFAHCVGVPDSTPDQVAVVHSEDFSMGNMGISSQAASYKSQSSVDSDIRGLGRVEAQTCLQALLTAQVQKGLPAGATIGTLTVTVTPGSKAATPPNLVAVATAQVTVTVSGSNSTVYVEAAFITGPQIEAEVDFQNVGSQFDQSVAQALIAKVAARVDG